MTNPFLVDMIERVTRDTERKLGWNDRLIGTMRVALGQGVIPRRYAFGAAAALALLDPTALEGHTPAGNVLDASWRGASPDQTERDQLVALVQTALGDLRAWQAAGFPDLEAYFLALAFN